MAAPSQWTVAQVAEWVRSIGLPEAAQSFAEHEVEGAALLDLTTAELKEQGEMGRQLAPPMLAAVYVIEALRTRVGPPGGIHAKQHFKFHRPAIVGERLYTTAKILRLFIKRERQYVEMLTESRNQTGELVTTGMITRIWGKGE